MTLVEAANEHDEAMAIATALRGAIVEPEATAALVTADRDLARRVSAELLRFGIRADDSGGTPLARTPPGEFLALLLQAVFRPGDPVPISALLKHPFLQLGAGRAKVRHAAETIELVALRGGTGRPDIAELLALFDSRHAAFGTAGRKPFWLARIGASELAEARLVLGRLGAALASLVACRGSHAMPIAEIARITIAALEALARDEAGGTGRLYEREAGEKFAGFFRALIASTADFSVSGDEWPDIAASLLAAEIVKPAAGGDGRVAIWGTLEARLQTVGTLVVGGLNEGSWPQRAQSDRFMSRMMKGAMELEPPERRIGLAAHDFMMAMGHARIVLTRSARAGDAPAAASRWLQRLLTFAGPQQAARLRGRGDEIIAWARGLDAGPPQKFAARPNPAPPLEHRPTRFSVTEIETLRRDPYAVYARRILALAPLDPLLRDPGASERGTLFHDIMRRFTETCPDPGPCRCGSASGRRRQGGVRRGRAAGRHRGGLVAALHSFDAADPGVGARPAGRRGAPCRRGRAPSPTPSPRPARRCPAMPTASICLPRARPTSSTTRPDRRRRRRRRTHCWRRSSHWKARC